MFPGVQFKSIVEYAPSQRVPKQWSKKDGREGTIFKGTDIFFCTYLEKNSTCMLSHLDLFKRYFPVCKYKYFLDEHLDSEFLEFLEFLAKPVENLPSAEIQLERREADRAG